MSATVKTPSPLGVTRPISPNMGQLDNIFQSIKKQIDQWGENAKWKIDLILLDDPKQPESTITSPQQPPSNTNTTIPISSTIEYPWDYISPSFNNWCKEPDDLQQKLQKSIEHQHYLENVIWSQAEQIKKTSRANDDNIINTMKTIYLLSQNEEKIRHIVETNLLQKDINTLSTKLRKMANILYNIENIELPPDDANLSRETLLSERKTLLRKLRLADFRLSARDAELEHLRDLIETSKMSTNNNNHNNNTHSHHQPKSFIPNKLRKPPSYLFQQQYSPRNSEVRLSEAHHPLSGLDSLGIVADQMLSDPEFESSSASPAVITNEKRLRSRLDDRRSQRSIDSAATLLAMPQLMVSTPQPLASTPQLMVSSPQMTAPSTPRMTQDSFEEKDTTPEQSSDHIPKKPRSTYTRWTEAEDALLRSAVKKYGHSNWEACSKMVHGRSNIQCRNRWIRHLEHKPVLDDKPSSPTVGDARQSPSIAALLNSNAEDSYSNYSPHTSVQLHDHNRPPYRPPSPMTTPKGKRRSAEALSDK
ncbi:hypothetical protein BDB01DRAFT_833432 [Pilobolus umbonatus]|nr:hypothetical protein BDB01DRAFT_833432 [Pilobolus umbonatus]